MIDVNKLEERYIYKLKSIPRGMDSTKSIPFSCNAPWKNVVIDSESNCFICRCDGWLPIPVGQVQEFNSFEDVINSPIAKELQQDIIDKKFTYCAVDTCGITKKDLQWPTMWLQISLDDSCNLACPSCRRDIIAYSEGPEFDRKSRDMEKILQWMGEFNDPLHITLSSNGDPLASKIIRPMIKHYTPKSNQTFEFKTNGLLMKKHLADSPLFNNITTFSISVDAGSKKVYEEVRRPGKWDALIENLEFLKKHDKNKLINFQFVIQQKNYRDLDNLVTLVEKFDCTAVVFELQDWGTWNYEDVETPDSWTITNGTYLDQDVLRQEHPEHEDAMASLIKVSKNRRIHFSPLLENLINETK